jgi:hypothetical protein
LYGLKNTSSAYEYYGNALEYGNIGWDEADKAQRYAIKDEHRARRRQKANARAAAKLVTAFLVVAVGLSVLIYSNVQLAELTKVASALDAELIELQKQEAILNAELETRIGLHEVEERARSMGMSKLEKHQIRYVTLGGQDHAEVLRAPTVSGMPVVFAGMARNLGAVVEYLK